MAETLKKKSWMKRIFFGLLILVILLVMIVFAARILITTSAGSRFIETQVNKRSFGSIEAIEIEGLSGDPLGTLSIEKLALKDKDGVWLRANDIYLTWKPFEFFKDHVWVHDLTITETDIMRRPVLNVTERGDPLKFTLEDINLTSIDIEESVIGQSLSAEAAGRFIALPSGAITAKLDMKRLDEAGDELTLDFNRRDNGDMNGIFDVTGVPGGPISTLLKAPQNVTIAGTGKISGTAQNGSGEAVVRFGETENIDAQIDWTEAAVNAEANINLQGWTAFTALQDRFGKTLVSTLRLERNGDRSFAANLNVPGLSLDARGRMPEAGLIPSRADIELVGDRVSALVPLPDGYAAGQVQARGRIGFEIPYAFDGDIAVANITTPYGSALSAAGPLSAALDEDMVRYDANLVLKEIVTMASLPVKLASTTRLASSGRYDMDSRRITFGNTKLVSGANTFTGEGFVALGGQSLKVTGRADIQTLAQGALPEGHLKTDFDIRKAPDSLLAVTANGAFAPKSALPEPFTNLVGERLIFDTAMRPTDGGLQIREARLRGDNFRAALTGTLTERLNISGEAVVSAPISYKAINIDGGAEGSFVVTGPRTDPSLRLDAEAGTFTVQNYAFNDARLRTEITNLLDAPKGPVQIDANTKYGPLTASAQFASQSGEYIAEDIDVTWGRISAGGALSYPEDKIVTGELSLRLPERDGQYARAQLNLSNQAGTQGVNLTADAKKIQMAGFQINTLSATAEGTLQSLTGKLDAEGRHGNDLIARRFDIDAPLTLNRTGSTYTATLTPEAKYGDIALSSRSPITITYDNGTLSVDAPLTISDGLVDIDYQRGAAREILKIDAQKLPVTLVPMTGNLADTRGRVSAELDLSYAGASLQGGGTITLTDWRGFDIDKGNGLSGTVDMTINDRTASMALTASSPEGFKADGNLRLPLNIAQSLTATRINMNAPLSGAFSAGGAASAVFGLATPSDAELGGTVDANINIAGTASNPRVDGQANGQDIRFEAPELGTRIRQGRFTANFTNDSVSVQDVFVSDGDGGSLAGSGQFKLGEFGRPLGKLDIQATKFRALDRRDVEARVNGNLDFVSEAKNATLSGDITVNKAEVKQFVTGQIGVVEIEVEEINRPNDIAPVEISVPQTPINLNVRVRAPRKIFIRSRGLDVEMAVDATIKGTITDPLIYGEARIIRGGYRIAGKELSFTNGTILFDGELPSARVNFDAETETQNLNAGVKIRGTVEKPEIELSSTPERPKDEILSALLFGRSATELSTIEAAQLAGALAQFSGSGGGFDLLGGLRDAFGVNQLSVNFNPDGSAQLVGGRYLANDVYLQVFSGAGSDQSGAIIDWEIRKNISLRSRIRADNEQALSLKWKRDF